jgi:hypothetical protein
MLLSKRPIHFDVQNDCHWPLKYLPDEAISQNKQLSLGGCAREANVENDAFDNW